MSLVTLRIEAISPPSLRVESSSSSPPSWLPLASCTQYKPGTRAALWMDVSSTACTLLLSSPQAAAQGPPHPQAMVLLVGLPPHRISSPIPSSLSPLLSSPTPVLVLHPSDVFLLGPGAPQNTEVMLQLPSSSPCTPLSVHCPPSSCVPGGKVGLGRGGLAYRWGKVDTSCRDWGRECGVEGGQCGEVEEEGGGVLCREQEELLDSCYTQGFPFWEGTGELEQEDICCTKNLTTVLPRYSECVQ